MNPWHDVEIGEKAPEKVTAIIEIPRGSHTKYEIDKDYGMLRLDRILYSPFYYPLNYGFIPQTLSEDNDPADVLVLCQEVIQPLCLVEVKPIGVIKMIDAGEEDDKIVAVVTKDMSINYLNDVSELPAHFFAELKHFFEQYKKLENKTVVVKEMLGKQAALGIIKSSIKKYNETYKK
jgi:inorganic pyrophosphatase